MRRYIGNIANTYKKLNAKENCLCKTHFSPFLAFPLSLPCLWSRKSNKHLSQGATCALICWYLKIHHIFHGKCMSRVVFVTFLHEHKCSSLNVLQIHEVSTVRLQVTKINIELKLEDFFLTTGLLSSVCVVCLCL